MIAFVQGTVFEKMMDGSVLVSVQGIGYKVYVPSRIIAKYSTESEIFLYTFHRIAEGVNDLFGMETKEELELFQLLLSVSGIGPKSALAMSEMSPSHIQKAIEEEDIPFLTKVPGLGKKTASRLILELKGKLPDLSLQRSAPVSSAHADVFLALEGLGFAKKDIEVAFKNLPENLESASEEEMIKWGLRELG